MACGRLHGIFDAEDGLFALLFKRRQFEAVLSSEKIENGCRLQSARNHVGKGVRHDHGHDDGVVAAYFHHHEYRGHRSTQKTGEQHAHTDQAISSNRPGEMRKQDVLNVADGSPEHRADEKRGREHASRSTADERERGRNDLEARQYAQHPPGELVVHGLLNVDVACTHNLRSAEISNQADQKTGYGGLQVLRPTRQGLQARTQPTDGTSEDNRCQAAYDSQRAVGQQFLRSKQLNRRDAKHGLITKKPAHDNDAGDRGKHNGAENSRAPTADYFLDDEQDSGNGSVERGGQSGSGADGRDQAKFLARQTKAPAQNRSEACANLQRRILWSKRMAGSNGQRSSDEFSDCGAEWDVPVIDIERRLGLIDATAPHSRENMEHQDRHNQSRRGWRPEQMQSMGSEMWTEQTQANEIDRKTEADDGQGGEDPDEYGED